MNNSHTKFNDQWQQIFGNRHNLAQITSGELEVSPGRGLLYFFVIDEQVRYIGLTTVGFPKRLVSRFKNGITGYRPIIRRKLLNAYKRNRLRIVTWVLPIVEVGQQEIYCIRRYAAGNYLWNIKHNPHFDPINYQINFFGKQPQLSFYAKIHRLVAAIPPGRVATYKQLAALAGRPKSALAVYKLILYKRFESWYRVVKSNGHLAYYYPNSQQSQHQLLAYEQVDFQDDGRVKLAQHQWLNQLMTTQLAEASSHNPQTTDLTP